MLLIFKSTISAPLFLDYPAPDSNSQVGDQIPDSPTSTELPDPQDNRSLRSNRPDARLPHVTIFIESNEENTVNLIEKFEENSPTTSRGSMFTNRDKILKINCIDCFIKFL